MSRSGRILLRTGAGLFTLVGVLVFVLLLGIATEAGSRLSWRLAVALLDSPGLHISGVPQSGTWTQGLKFQNLHIEQDAAQGASMDLNVRTVSFSWQPWHLLDRQLVLDTVEIAGLRGQYTSGSAAAEPLTAASLQALLFALPLAITIERLHLAELELTVDGSVLTTRDLVAGLSLSSETVSLTALVWQHADFLLTGTLQLQRSLQLLADLQWQAPLAQHNLAGQLKLTGDLHTLQLTHHLTSPFDMTSEGAITPGLFAGEIQSLALSHQSAEVNIAQFGVPDLSVQGITLTTSGPLNAVDITGDMTVLYADLPATATAVALRWESGQLHIANLGLENPELWVAIAGELRPSPLTLQANWQLLRFSPGERYPQFRLSEVTGAGEVALETVAGRLESRVSIENLAGALNERPLQITGDLAFSDAALSLLSLDASSGDNSVHLQGSAQERLALDWQIQAPALAQIWELAQGSIIGTGTISGEFSLPEINGDLQADKLEVRQNGDVLRLAHAEVKAQYKGQENRITAQIQALSSHRGRELVTLLDAAQLSLEGNLAAHRIDLTLTHPEATAHLAAEGGWQDEGWQGSLQELSIRSPYGDWQSAAVVPVGGSQARVSLEQLCMVRDLTRVCASVAGSIADGLVVNARLDNLPLAWMNRDAADKPSGIQQLQDAFALNLPQGLSVEGFADIGFQAQGLKAGGWDQLSLDIDPQDLVLQLAREQQSEVQTLPPEIQRFGFSGTSLQLGNEAGVWHLTAGTTVADVSDDSDVFTGLQGSFSSDISMRESGDLEGSVAFQFDDLAWLESVAPMVRNPSGSLQGQAQIGGNKDQPQVVGSVALNNAALQLPDYGLQLHDIEGVLTSGSDNSIRLQLSAGSGPGEISLTSELTNPMLATRSFTAELKGSDFLVLKNASATLELSPDLAVDYQDNKLQVMGTASLAKSHVDLAQWIGELSNGGVSESKDVIIVRQADGSENALQQGLAMEVTLDVGLSLGEEVSLSGYGLDAMLTGQLDLEQQPGRPLLAYGELQIPTGTYEIYNQTLSARNGRLLFFGNPANPVLDIKAFRSTPLAEVGLLLTGPVSQIQGELYSTPTLPENEILALLVTGKSFNNVGSQDSDALLSTIANFGIERGQGLTSKVSNKLGLDSVSVNGGGNIRESSLGLGKHLTPNLVMHYEVGLFDRQFVLSLDYTLTEHLKLEVETGISQSVDISYTIEQE